MLVQGVRTAGLGVMQQHRTLVVIGHGAAGLAAALAAAEESKKLGANLNVVVLEKAPENSAGGNTRWSPSYIRMAAPDLLIRNFAEDLLAETGGKGDLAYFRALAANAVPTLAWLRAHNIQFVKQVYY